MKARNTAALALLISLAPGLAAAVQTRPFRLELPPLGTQAAPTSEPRGQRPLFASRAAERPARVAPLFRRNGNPNRAVVETRAQSLGRQALESVLDPSAPPALDEQRAEGQLRLKFQKQGNAFRDLNRSYREACDRVSAKIWDEPNGKRVRFDVAGKPGLGVEIPIGKR